MANLFPTPRFRQLDSNGAPLVGGKVYFYEAGTTTPKDTFTNEGAATANANPVILDSQGYADIWGSGSYKVIIKDSEDVTISTTDTIVVSGTVLGTGVVTNTNLANMAANTIKARVGSTSGVPSDVALAASQVIGRDATGNVAALNVGNGLVSASGSVGVGGTVVAGLSATSYDAGTKASGTFTPDPANGQIQHYINGGAHTLAPPATTTVITIEVLNNGSAGAITTSGFTVVSGDDLTTTDTHKFILDIRKTNTVSQLAVKAVQ